MLNPDCLHFVTVFPIVFSMIGTYRRKLFATIDKFPLGDMYCRIPAKKVSVA